MQKSVKNVTEEQQEEQQQEEQQQEEEWLGFRCGLYCYVLHCTVLYYTLYTEICVLQSTPKTEPFLLLLLLLRHVFYAFLHL